MVEPNPNSVEIMRHIDDMPPSVRALVHEYGYVIVAGLLNEVIGDNDDDPAEQLQFILENWRVRRQEEWLATNYMTPRTARRIVEAALARQAAKHHH